MASTTASILWRTGIGSWVLASALIIQGSSAGAAAPRGPSNLPIPVAPAAQPAPIKVDSAEQAADLLGGMIKEIAAGIEMSLDFESAKVNFEKLGAIKPFADKLDDSHKLLYSKGLVGIGLVAGEPEAALEGCRYLMKGEEKEYWAVRGFFAAGFLGDDKAGRQMLAQIDPIKATDLAKICEPVGKRLPDVKLTLLDGRTMHWGEGKVVAVNIWATITPDVYTQTLPVVKELNERNKKYEQFAMLGVNLNLIDKREAVKKYVNENGMRWPHCFEGKGPEADALTNRVFGTKGALCLLVVGADRRVLYCDGPASPLAQCAIYAGLRQIEKKQAKSKTDKLDRPPVATQPKSPAGAGPATGSGPVLAKPPPAASSEKAAAQLLGLAETYRAAGMKDKANELLRQVIHDFPDSPEAAKAREALGGKP